MKNDKLPHGDCIGCATSNPYLCKSFPGKAPQHAQDYDNWQRLRVKELAAERRKEEQELLETFMMSTTMARA